MASNGILIGLGSPIMSDDGIGLLVAEGVHRRLSGFDLNTTCGGGFEVVDIIRDYKTAVVIDAMVTGRFETGTLVRLDLGTDIATLRSGPSHALNFVEALKVARSCNVPLPETIVVYAIEVKEVRKVSDMVSQVLLDRIPQIVEEVVQDIEGPGR
jgi:hydrogenase maturation protease